MSETNGTMTPKAEADYLPSLLDVLTPGYRTSLAIQGLFNPMGMPLMTWRQDIEIMRRHPAIRQPLNYFKGGIAGAEFWGGANPDAVEGSPEAEKGLPICPENEKVGRFIKEQCERFWDRGVPTMQDSGYEYGWTGAEALYDDSDGVLKWESLKTFSPVDTYLLTRDHEPVGVRVQNVIGAAKNVDLWFAGTDVPAKGLWYAHQPRFGSFYGESQLLAAWRPWRRLAWLGGAEIVVDGAIVRCGYQGPIARAPSEDLQGPPGIPNTTLDSQGNPRRYARDIMRQIVEQYMAGGSVVLPSTRDDKGEFKYQLEVPTSVLTGIEGLIGYVKYLCDEITAGIGVPPELLQAAETGSGYSGRRIPLEAFLANQQCIADAFLNMFVVQVLRPLVRWNFGDVKWEVKVKSLIQTRTKQAQGAQKPQQQPGTPQPSPAPSTQASFSLVTDRVREIARRVLVAG